MKQAEEYSKQLGVQLRKGFLAYCVLKICAHGPKYTSEVIKDLHRADMVVVEGTIYPLLSRLQKDGLLEHNWQESLQGPPRKYYQITEFGQLVLEQTAKDIKSLNNTLNKL